MKYDVIVIGGGHAGIEAANIAARMGLKTTLLTLNLDQIGQMSCNPSIGGVGKGHMVRELDALGGAMGRLADATGIHYRVLNSSRGLSVRGPRAQIDRIRYKIAARNLLENIPNLNLFQGIAKKIHWIKDTKTIKGVELIDGSFIHCDAVIIAAGTFLNGQILIGNRRFDAGRAGEPSCIDLANQFKALGLRINRLKTGTSPRIASRSIDISRLEPQPTDKIFRNFSFFYNGNKLPQVSCYITHTTKETEDIVCNNLHLSSTYGGHISGIGPRYCPSIEDKFIRFKNRPNHQVFVEPDSLENKEVYLSGISTSMPLDIQTKMIHSLIGFEKAEIIKPGYAIEYDSFDSLQLNQDLSVNCLDGVWFAGQVNGTTGYEEAAGQGIIAGINAVRWLQNREPIILNRGQAYIGVMIDDLVTKGTDEPYRMLTARAEHRLGLACDLADVRLLDVAKAIGVLTYDEIKLIEDKSNARKNLVKQCSNTYIAKDSHISQLVLNNGINGSSFGITVSELFKRQQINNSIADEVLNLLPEWQKNHNLVNWDPSLERDLLLFELRYKAFQKRETRLLAGQTDWDHIRIPTNFDIENAAGLSIEVREKLKHHRPENLGQASRIPGITPTAVILLHMLIERYYKNKDN